MKIALIFLSLFLLWFTKDLKQNNSERIFLSRDSLKSYDHYRSLAPSLDFLIVKIKSKDLSLIDKVEVLEESFEDLEFIKPPKTTNFRAQNLSFNFYGDDFFSFIVLIPSDYTRTSELINKIEETFHEHGPSFLGNPYTNHHLDLYSNSIKEYLFPICFVFSFLLVWVFVGNINLSLNIFFPALFSALSALTCIKIFSAELNLVSSILPLMSFVICLSLMFHLYYTLEGSHKLKQNYQSVIKEKFAPVALMISTTAIGFGSLYFSKIKAIADFGLISMFLIIFTGAIGLYWFRYCSFPFQLRSSLGDRKFLKFVNLKRTVPIKFVWPLSFFILVAGIVSFKNLEVLTDATRYFPASSMFREKSEEIAKTVAGIPLYDILVDQKPTKETLRELESKVEKLSPDFKLIHLDKILEEANSVYTGEPTIPNNLHALAVLKSQIGLPLIRFFENAKGYRLLVTGIPIDVSPYEENLRRIRSFYPFDHIDGLYFHLMTGQKDMMETLYYSFLSSVFIISVLAALYLRSFRVLLIFNLVNIFPAFLGLALIKMLGFSLNIATIMTFSIALGLVVDGTFHLIHAMRKTSLSFEHFKDSTVIPIVLSTLIFCFSFGLFIFHPFLPIRQFGVSLSIICFCGLFFDLYILPSLYLKTHKIWEHFHERL